ncbi:MAG: hypothetical protein K1X87_00675 [Dehalococcoidia bacterium]|nr:hypothetical protein [Dehalococcoidia bacterium]
MNGESTYGETHLGNIEVLNDRDEVVAVGRLSGAKYEDAGATRWQGHLTAVAPPGVAQDLVGEYRLRFPDGSLHPALVEYDGSASQLSPGLEVAVEGLGAPPF